jgi:acetyl-CoA carboxylase biotin carboxylase subunit
LFKKLLVANRGEIALRIIRACQELGIKTVAVYSEPDRESLHVRFADEAVCIGPASPTESYLDVARIIASAEITGAEAIHPGYGFLAENAEFSEICRRSGIVFIGPSANQIQAMGDKATARKTMQRLGVPTVPGSEGLVADVENAKGIACDIGFPVMIKASAGGGGKGMRVVENEEELPQLFHTTQAEAKATFGNSDVYIEKYISGIRHVEIQIFGDSHGKVIHLGERDCSTQRRHQKLIEESPSSGMTSQMRRSMGEAAIAAGQGIDYVGAGTVEFLVDEEGEYYFIEMNTRIQVEHPVTEVVTGLDLVKEQIRVAFGEELSFPSGEPSLQGHAIEFRINAEDPSRNFMPSPGRIQTFQPPGGPGIRLDTHLYTGYQVPPYYDSLLAKLIVSGSNREEAIVRGRHALDSFIIEGVETSIPFLSQITRDDEFIAGGVDTGFVERFLKRWVSE